jgi:hypothetical protein
MEGRPWPSSSSTADNGSSLGRREERSRGHHRGSCIGGGSVQGGSSVPANYWLCEVEEKEKREK